MRKQILFGKEAREKILKGVNTIADAVCVTLGANGRNVLIGESYVHDYNTYNLPTRVTKDGISVAKQVQLDDPTENRGVMLLREASQKTMDLCGDGTTTSIVLARAIINEGMKLVEAGANPMELKKGIDKAVEYVVEELKKMAIPIGDDIEKIRQIATVSANNDSSIGDLIAEAFAKIGKDGDIDIEESKGVNTEIKIADGFKFDKGWYHQLFVTNKAKNECELIEPYILLYDRPITQMKVIAPLLQQIAKEQKPVLIICDDMDGEALAFLTMNVAQKNIAACVVKCPSFNATKRETMEDIAAVTGATYLTDNSGIGLENAQLKHLGIAKKVVISKDNTVVIDGKKNQKEFDELFANLKMNLVSTSDAEEKEKIDKRIARLIGGVAVISVGGTTEVEMKERKDRVDDSVRATKAAISEGVVAGGGVSLVHIDLPIVEDDNLLQGYNLIFGILSEPLKQICKNAGANENDILKKVSLQNVHVNGYEWPVGYKTSYGYNAITGQIEDLIEAGIIDPFKVVRCSLQNAASVAGMILTSECVIVDIY